MSRAFPNMLGNVDALLDLLGHHDGLTRRDIRRLWPGDIHRVALDLALAYALGAAKVVSEFSPDAGRTASGGVRTGAHVWLLVLPKLSSPAETT